LSYIDPAIVLSIFILSFIYHAIVLSIYIFSLNNPVNERQYKYGQYNSRVNE
jgi:cell division protein FtsL